jgi:tRNA (mo5U34)-methyltransferase
MTATDLRARAAELSWYHTIDLGGGVVTPGFFDTRATVGHVPLPGSLEGRRCLDVGTWDGFWAFELERRGAASVTAVDIEDPDRWDWPPQSRLGAANADRLRYLAEFKSSGASFALAREALGSSVERVDCSVYDLHPDRVGRFDFVFLGSLLLHLRDPVAALTRVRHVLKPGGRMLVNDPISLEMTLLHPRRPAYTLALLPGRPFWWMPNVAGLRRYMEKAGFRIVDSGGPYWLKRGPGYARPREATAWQRLVFRRGMPHGWVLGEAA